MPDDDRPVTHRELRAALQEFRADLSAELRGEFATKAELRSELAALEARLRADLATKSELRAVRDELRTHFDVIAESLRGDFRTMFDWMKANINGLVLRVDALEAGHERTS